MKKLLLSCLVFFGMLFNAQITLGTGTTQNRMPVDSYWGYSYAQQIFTKNEINAAAAGNITGLKFYLPATASLSNSSEWTVYVGHTTKSNFASNIDWIPVSELTQVFTGTVTNDSGVVTVTFTSPFAYNNVDNLVVACDENKSGYNAMGDRFYNYSSSSNSTLAFINDNTNPDPNNPSAGTLNANKSIVTLEGLTLSSALACPVITAPLAGGTNLSLTPTFSWNSVANATGYTVSLGTTSGGTDILNNVDVGNVTSYELTAPLNYATSYYLTINSNNGSTSSSGCTELNFTTKNIPCPTVTAPVASATQQSLTPTFTWEEVPGATSYRISIGTTSGATDILNSQDVGNVLTYTYNGSVALVNATTYFYTISATDGTHISDSCVVRSFQTFCDAVNVPYSQNFDGATVPGLADCTQIQNLGSGNNWVTAETPATPAGFSGNVLAYKYSYSNPANTWFYTQGVNLTAGVTYYISYKYGNNSTTYKENLKVAIGTAADAASMTTVIADYPNIQDSTVHNISNIAFTPSTTGVYYLGFHAYSIANQYNLFVDDIQITDTQLATQETTFTKNDVKVYPNPFTDILNISDIKDVKNVTVVDMSGRVVKSIVSPVRPLELGDLKSGMYMLKIDFKDGSTKSVKAIKK